MMNELYVSIQQAQKDPSQMEALIEKFHPLILKYARHLNKTERDDAIQDMIVAFILIIKKMDLNNFPQEASEKYLLSYIQKAMYTRFLDLSKRQTQIITMDIDDLVYVERVDDALSPSEMVELREMLTGLTALQRKVLVIRYLYGYSDMEGKFAHMRSSEKLRMDLLRLIRLCHGFGEAGMRVERQTIHILVLKSVKTG